MNSKLKECDTTMEMTELIKSKTLDWGADICGVADLTDVQEELHALYGDRFDGLNYAVSFGVYLPKRICDEVLEHPTHTYLAYYDIANALINQIGLKVNNYFVKQGYEAYPVPASQRLGAKDNSIFSHRMAAQLAGIGWIGKSCNFVTEEVGPRLRLGTVLTDAPLVPDSPMEDRCGSCTLCTDACPAHAILGKNFDPKDDLSERFDFKKCDAFLTETRQTFGKRICGRCVAVCRYGKSKERGNKE